MAIVTDTIDDSIASAESFTLAFKRPVTAEDGTFFSVSSVQARPVIGRVVSSSDTLNSTESVSPYFFTPRSISDSVRTSESVTNVFTFKPAVADVVRTIDLTGVSFVQALAESLGLEPQLVAVQALTVIERVGVSRQVLARMLYGVSARDAIQLLDRLLRFFSGDIEEALSLGETVAPQRLATSQLADGFGLDESVERILVLRVTAPESINIDDVSLTQMFFDAELADLLDIAAMYVAPNDSFTVWNVNAVTGSVSRYENYAFNSFARFGQMYIGADENGLYELNGCNDEGEAIIARIKSGLAQLTASRFTMVRDAYMGIRSDGTFILRVTTGEGKTYDYKFDAQNMKTTRVPLGKGMRTRYMSFELISTGDDFDLESVEFIPLMSSRRV